MSTADKTTQKYLTFMLGDEEYGFDALKVEGIINLQPVTPIPNAPYYVKGVTTVRGKAAPIIDARAKLGLPPIEDTPETCIILITLTADTWAGLVVDTVKDVIDIAADDIEAPPTLGGYDESEIVGLAKSGDKVKILLNIDAVLADVTHLA